MFRYSSKTLETMRFDQEPSPQDRHALLASGWERHPFERRLFLLRREVRPIRLVSVESFVLPVEADWHDPAVRAALA